MQLERYSAKRWEEYLNYTTIGLSSVAKIVGKINSEEWGAFSTVLSEIPYAKIIPILFKEASKINDPNEALKDLIISATGNCFGAALAVHHVPVPPKTHLQKKAKRDLKKPDHRVELYRFDIDSPEEFPLFKELKLELKEIVTQAVDENFEANNYWKKVKDFIFHNYRSFFWKQLDRNPHRYESLVQETSKRGYEEGAKTLLLGVYRKGLSSKFLENTLDEPKQPLAHLYVKPYCEVYKPCIDGEGGFGFTDSAKAGLSDDLFELVEAWVTEEDGFLSNKLINERPKVILLYGMPGQGKSSFCKKLLNNYLGANGQGRAKHWYYLELGSEKLNVDSNLKANPLEGIIQALSLETKVELGKRDLKNSVLILDGLEEMQLSEDFKRSDVNYFVEKICRSANKVNNAKIIVTCRNGFFRNSNHLPNALVLRLKEFDFDQKVEWLSNFIRFAPGKSIRTENQLTREKLENHYEQVSDEVVKFCAHPQLLRLIADKDAVPHNKEELYELHMEVLSTVFRPAWKEGNKNSTWFKRYGQPRTRQLMEKILEQIAWKMVVDQKNVIAAYEIEDFNSSKNLIKALELIREEGSMEIVDTITSVLNGFYFLKSDGENNDESAFSFSYDSFKYYFAGNFIFRCVKAIFYDQKSKKFRLGNFKDRIVEWHNLFSGRVIPSEVFDNFLVAVDDNNGNDNLPSLKEILRDFGDSALEFSFLDVEKLSEESSLKFGQGIVGESMESFYAWLVIVGSMDDFIENDGPMRPNPVIHEEFQHKQNFIFHLKKLFAEGYRKNINLSGIDFSTFVSNDSIPSSRSPVFNLSRMDLRNVNFSNANLAGADLREANLKETNFTGTILKGADLTGTNISEAVLLGVDLTNAKFDRFRLNSSAQANLSQAVLNSLSLNGVVFSGHDLTGVSFQGATLINCKFDFIKLGEEGLESYETFLTAVNFKGATVSEGTSFKNVKNMTECQFDEATIKGVDFTGTGLKASTFVGAKMQGAILVDANLEDVSFDKAIMDRVDMTGAKGISFNALTKAQSLKDCRGISADVLKRLSEERPDLLSKAQT